MDNIEAILDMLYERDCTNQWRFFLFHDGDVDPTKHPQFQTSEIWISWNITDLANVNYFGIASVEVELGNSKRVLFVLLSRRYLMHAS